MVMMMMMIIIIMITIVIFVLFLVFWCFFFFFFFFFWGGGGGGGLIQAFKIVQVIKKVTVIIKEINPINIKKKKKNTSTELMWQKRDGRAKSCLEPLQSGS